MQQCFVSHSFGAIPISILATKNPTNLKIRQFTTLVKVKVNIRETYGVTVSSPKQFDLDRATFNVIEMAHWVLKVRPYLKN